MVKESITIAQVDASSLVSSREIFVLSWIQESANPQPLTLDKKRKRNTDPSDEAISSRGPQRRHHLREITVNTMAYESPGTQTRSRNRRRHDESLKKPLTPKRIGNTVDIFDENAERISELENTPRPAYSLPPPSSSSKTNRSTSPVKMAEMENLPVPLHTETLVDLGAIDDEHHALHGACALLKDLKKLSHGIGVLDSTKKVTSPHFCPGYHD